MESLSKSILQGTLEGRQRRGRQRKWWMYNIKEWASRQCQNCSQGPPAEKTGSGCLLNRPSCPPDDLVGQGTELNCTIQLPSLPVAASRGDNVRLDVTIQSLINHPSWHVSRLTAYINASLLDKVSYSMGQESLL